MGSYRLEWRPATKKDLRGLPQQDVRRIVEAVEQLAENPFPHGCTKLSGSDHAYRIRIGDYRVVYEISKGILLVTIIRIAHRRDVYRH